MSRLLFTLPIALLLCHFAAAQAINEEGVKLYGSFHGTSIESVNLASGHLEVRIPLISLPQRSGKLNLAFSVRLRAALWNKTQDCTSFVKQPCTITWAVNGQMPIYGAEGPPAAGPQQLEIGADEAPPLFVRGATKNYFYGPGRSPHPFTAVVGASNYETVDASGISITDTSTNVESVPLTILPDGSRYFFAGNNTTILEDTNGNQITFNSNGTITDTLGRTIQQPALGPHTTDLTGCTGALTNIGAQLWQVPGANGSTSTFKFCYGLLHVFTGQFVDDQYHIEPNGDWPVLQSIVLPDGTAWTFYYSQQDANGKYWGDLVKIVYPTGGSVSYTWDHVTGCQTAFAPPASISAIVKTRTVDANDGTGPHQWKYSGFGNRAVVTDPLGNDTAHNFSDFNGSCSLYETSTQYYDGPSTGTAIKTVVTDFSWFAGSLPAGMPPSPAESVVPIRVTTTWPNGQVTKTEYDYDQGFDIGNGAHGIYGKQVAERDYDFGNGSPGPLLKTTSTTYLWQSNTSYLNLNILDTPAAITTNDSAGSQVAKTTFAYDGSTPSPSGVTTSHDLNPVNGNTRGNTTSVSHWLNGSTVSTANCPVSVSNGFLTQTNTYLDSGMLGQSIDPCGHRTTFQYDSTPALGAGTYLTQSCNHLNQCSSMTYDLNLGLPKDLVDPNTQKTSHTYDDIGRLKTISFPDTGEADFFYPDNVTVEKKVVIDRSANLWADGFFYFDGLGRKKQTRLVDPEDDVFTDIGYDLLGRPAAATNPHRSVSSSTDGTTRNSYDALGRITDVTKQDGGAVHSDYSANVVTVFDETQRQRRLISDALGRLIEVDEPGNPSAVVANNYANLATDGNFAVFGPANDIKWQSNTHGATNTVYGVNVQDDGNVIKYTPTWGSALPTTTGTATNGSWGCVGSKLFTNQTLASGQCMQSPNNRFLLIMQTAGNLVLYDMSYSPGSPIFYSGSTGVPGSHAVMQSDGNLVIYTPSNTAFWSTGTVTGTASYMLQLQDQGNLVIYKDIWETGTVQSPNNGSLTAISCSIQGNSLGMGSNLGMGSCLTSPSGRFALNMQTDGNLALYDRTANPASMLWSTNTQLTPLDPIVAARTLYSYDGLDNLTRIEQHGNTSDSTQWRVRTFTYDSLSRLIQANNPESGQVNYSYDADGNLVTKTDARSVVTNYAYDRVHRLTGKSYSDGTPSVTNTYDQPCCGVTPSNAVGRLVSSISGNTKQVFSYDAMGRIVTQWDCPPSGITRGSCYVISAQYNQIGGLTSLTYPSGRNVATTYNAAGRPTAITLAQFNGAAVNYPYYTVPQSTSPGSWGYLPTGAMNRGTFGNGVIETTGYNDRLQISSIIDVKGSQTLFSKNYNYYDSGNHNNGNIMSISDALSASKNQTFQYDSLNRILSAIQADNSINISYTIDAWGNMRQSGTSNFVQNFDNRNRIETYSYDSAGNLLNDGFHLYSFDAENRIKSVDGSSAAYTYNAFGNRVRKDLSSGLTTEYLMFSGNTIAELNPASGAWTDYIFNAGKRYAKDSSSNGTGVQYYQGDHLGTTRIMTDASGTKVSDCSYGPFGEELSCSPNNVSNHYKFTGKERDTESGLDLMGARYFSNNLGRFVQPDPIYIADHRLLDPQLLNVYQYGRNNPLRFTDVTGLDVKLDCEQKPQCGDSVKELNSRKDAQFKISQNKKTGLLQVDGKVDASKLSEKEHALYNAITDTDHHATLSVVSESDTVQFGRFDGNGHNTLDHSDLSQLNNVSPQAAGEVIAHEAVEAYGSSFGNGMNYEAWHGFASQFFPEATHDFSGECRVCSPAFTLRDWTFGGKDGVTVEVKTILRTAVPNADRRYDPGKIVEVKRAEPQ